jgi:hypothetical protein
MALASQKRFDIYNPMDYSRSMQTIVELPEFSRRSEKLLSATERLSIINYLAAHPAAGDIMQGTGGVRIIYYVHNETIPLFLLTLFGKGEKSNLSKSERNDLAKFTTLLINNYGGRNE